MMLTITRVQEKGQVTIPLEIRKKMNLKKGDMITFVETESGVVIQSLDDAADALFVDLKKKLGKKEISIEKLMERSLQAGGDTAITELGLNESEKEVFYQILSLRAQSAVKAIRENAHKYGTDTLTKNEIQSEIEATRREKQNVDRP
jgi:AbrB family looped-hinge helix DNA binding protein